MKIKVAYEALINPTPLIKKAFRKANPGYTEQKAKEHQEKEDSERLRKARVAAHQKYHHLKREEQMAFINSAKKIMFGTGLIVLLTLLLSIYAVIIEPPCSDRIVYQFHHNSQQTLYILVPCDSQYGWVILICSFVGIPIFLVFLGTLIQYFKTDK